eukprot:10136144-Heterocapsa_arctica.AAC.1
MNPEDRMVEDAGIPIREQRRQNQLATPSTQDASDHSARNQDNNAPPPQHAGRPISYGPMRSNATHTNTPPASA